MSNTSGPAVANELFEKTTQPSSCSKDTSPNDLPSDDDLFRDMSVFDLEDIAGWLWMIGSENNISALHHQKVILRDVIPSERIRLHLVWFDRIIYIKPFPLYLFNHDFIHQQTAANSELRRCIQGFLLSYCALVRSPLDLDIAHKHFLLPETITWECWKFYRNSVLASSSHVTINGRYRRGELRLNRLNLVYRITGRGLVYFTVHRQYDTYFRQFVALFVTVFALLAMVLTAMQVMVGIEGIGRWVIDVCYATAVAVIIFEALCLGVCMAVFVVFFVYNSIRAWRVRNRVERVRQVEAAESKAFEGA